jgi:hypothetical protein
LRYSDHLDQITLTQIDLSKVLDRWIQATETIGVGEHGSYSLLLEDIADKSIVLNYAQADTRVWKTDADFLRPKWGIYRSLLDKASLLDEMLYFADFSIEEKSDLPEALSTLRINAKQYSIYPNPAATHFTIKDLVILPNDTALLYNAKGQLLQTFSLQTNQIAISTLVPGAYYLVLRNNRLTKAYIPFVKE